MDIQQDYQNQQYQQDTLPCNPKPDSIFKHISSLDALTEFGELMMMQLLFWMDNFNNGLLLSGTTYRQAVSIWTKTEQT